MASAHAPSRASMPYIPIPTGGSRHVAQHPEHQSCKSISFFVPARSGYSVLLNKVICFETRSSSSKKHGSGGNAWSLFNFLSTKNQFAASLRDYHVPFQPFQCSVGVVKTHPDCCMTFPAASSSITYTRRKIQIHIHLGIPRCAPYIA